jgi:hypothetical protein
MAHRECYHIASSASPRWLSMLTKRAHGTGQLSDGRPNENPFDCCATLTIHPAAPAENNRPLRAFCLLAVQSVFLINEHDTVLGLDD